MQHERQVYDILTLLGDLGGVIEIICLITAFFLGRWNEHSFIIKAIQKLYLARTKDDNLFIKVSNPKAL